MQMNINKNAAPNDLQTYISMLLESGEICVVEREVDPEYELAAVVSRSQKVNDRPLLFKKVKGSDFPVVANMYGSFKRIGEFLGAKGNDLNSRWNEVLTTLPPHSYDYINTIDVSEELQYGNLSDLPHIKYREKDAAPYITSGVFLAHDPDTGIPNLSFCRVMMQGDNSKMACCIDAPHDLAKYQAKAEARGKDLKVAILIGAPPSVFLAAVAALPIDQDELQLAAHIVGGKLDMRPARSLDFMVPAATEIVIEATIRANERTEDGPFGEYLGYYCEVNHGAYVLDILNISWRKNACFQGLLCGSSEDLTLLAVSWGARIYSGLIDALPGIQEVTISAAPSASIVKIDKQYEAHGRDVIDAVFKLKPQYNRMCIVVDKDIDIHDLKMVWWSFLTRGSLDKRIHCYPDLGGVEGENFEYSGYLGVDATAPLSAIRKRAVTPGEADLNLNLYITK